MERKLASIQVISEIKPIEGADMIECARVNGWDVVVRKNEFKVGDKVIYFEIDSWIPHELFPSLSKGKEPREYNGIKGERLRTVRLRGQLSQGLILSPTYETVFGCEVVKNDLSSSDTGADVTELLGVQKWEAPVPAQLQGQVVGLFPSQYIKSDQERAQNLTDKLFTKEGLARRYEITLKLDGSSCSVYQKNDGSVGVCSRNLELKVNEENKDNSFIRAVKKTGLFEVMADPEFAGLMIQLELMGPGIQGNRENLPELDLYAFNIQRLGHTMIQPKERIEVIKRMWDKGATFKICPIAYENVSLSELEIWNIDQLKKFADRNSLVNDVAEGFVFKQVDGDFQFKIINDRFLLNEK